MKKIILFLILSLILISCKNDGGSIYAMEQRYRNFLNILPDDVKNDYTLNSDKYGNMYKEWINEFNTWTDNILNEEAEREQEISARITPDKIEYALDNKEKMAPIRANARNVIVENYSLHKTIPQHLEYIESIIKNYKIHQMKDNKLLRV